MFSKLTVPSNVAGSITKSPTCIRTQLSMHTRDRERDIFVSRESNFWADLILINFKPVAHAVTAENK